jgi:hypothetical protein
VLGAGHIGRRLAHSLLDHPEYGLQPVASSAAPYAAVVGATSVAVAGRCPDGARRGVVPAALVAMQVGWGVGFWQGVARLAREAAGSPGPERLGSAPV